MVCDLLDAYLQRQSPLLDKKVRETSESGLFWHRRDNNARIVVGKRLVKPEEVRVSPEYGEGGLDVERR